MRSASLILSLLIFYSAAPLPAAARVIDDFSVGPIALMEPYGQPGSEVANQIGMDANHVAGGARSWRYDVGKAPQVEPPVNSSVRMGVTPEPVGQMYFQADDGLTAINFALRYDARVNDSTGPGLSLDMTLEGHNAIVWEFNRAVFDDDNGYLSLHATSPNGTMISRFNRIANSETPFTVTLPLFGKSGQTAFTQLSTLASISMIAGNGYHFGEYELNEIRTTYVRPGDFDGDDDTDGSDFLLWQRNLGSQGLPGGAMQSQGDANFDGVVNKDDLLFWRLGSAGPTTGPTGVAIPEPAALTLAAGALASVFGRLSRRTANHFLQTFC